MKVVIDDVANQVSDFFDHLLALDRQAAFDDRPRVLASFLEGKSRQLLPVLSRLADPFNVLLNLG